MVSVADPEYEGNVTVTRVLIIATLCAAWAAPSVAASKFAVPEGCTAFLTAQLHGCVVSQHYRCEADAPGDQRSALMDSDGLFYLSHIDRETRWIDSISVISGTQDKLTVEADPASFSTLLMTGRDDFDFRTENNFGEVLRYTGYDSLTGERVVIDGVTLEQTRFELSGYSEDGSVLFRRKGKQFIHRDWRLFFADRETAETPEGQSEETFSTPVTFSLPGEAGFLDAEPRFDCEITMTGAPLPLEKEPS